MKPARLLALFVCSLAVAVTAHADDKKDGPPQAAYFKKVMDAANVSVGKMADYGNYCGKNSWDFCGSYEAIKASHGDVTTAMTPIAEDRYDACCLEHDCCYGRNGCSITSLKTTAACRACDDAAVACWKAERSANPARYGNASDGKYPCHNCNEVTYRNGDNHHKAARRHECNLECRDKLFTMEKGEPCAPPRSPCAAGLSCQAGKCR